MNLSRRLFLEWLLKSSAAVSLPVGFPVAKAAELKHRRFGEAKSIVILGAGPAGLCAAYELERLGHQVTLLEARGHVGGRVHTLRNHFSEGQTAELGAARFQDSHDWVMKYLEDFGLKADLVPFYPDSLSNLKYSEFIAGQRLEYTPEEWPLDLAKYPLKFTDEEIALGYEGIFAKFIKSIEGDMGDPRADGWPPMSLKNYDDKSLRQAFVDVGISSDFFDLYYLGYESKAVDPGVSSLAQIQEIWPTGKPGSVMKLKNGNDQIPEAFRQKVKGQLVLNAEVMSVTQDRTGTEIVFKQGSSYSKMAADFVICTIPFSALRANGVSIQGISDQFQKVIDQLTYNSLSRVVFEVDQPYWRKNLYNGFASTDLPSEIWNSSFERGDNAKHLLQIYLKHTGLTGFDGLDSEGRKKFAFDSIDGAFPGLTERHDPSKTVGISWVDEKWSRGAVSELSLGQMTEFMPEIIKPQGRVYFAGEHVSAYHGWMQGGLESANRVVAEINRII